MKNDGTLKEIKITNRNSKCLRTKTGFNKRWNIKDDEEDKEQLKNRCLAVINNHLNSISEYYSRKYEISDFCSEIEIQLGLCSNNNDYDDFSRTKLFRMLNSLDLNTKENYNLFMYFIEIVLNYEYVHFEDEEINSFIIRIAEVLKISNANVMVCKNGDNYELYPMNTEFLSGALIVDVLSWLDEFEQSKKSFAKAIRIKRTESNYRGIIDELRLSIELLFKQLFKNEKSLENQTENIGRYFKENNISIEISNMYIKLMDLYTKFNNNNAKHNDKIKEIEIDYMIYLTGNFIRLIVLIEKSKQKL